MLGCFHSCPLLCNNVRACHYRLILLVVGDELTFSPHAHLETFLEPTELALVAVVLVDGTVPTAPARVRQVPPYAALEEALAPCNSERNIKTSG